MSYFSDKMKKIFKKHEAIYVADKTPVLKKKRKLVFVPQSYVYNIHRRSLPPGLNKPIVLNLTLRDADLLLKLFFKTRVAKNDNSEECKFEQIYYDKVRVDGYKADIFDNDVPITIDQENIKGD